MQINTDGLNQIYQKLDSEEKAILAFRTLLDNDENGFLNVQKAVSKSYLLTGYTGDKVYPAFLSRVFR